MADRKPAPDDPPPPANEPIDCAWRIRKPAWLLTSSGIKSSGASMTGLPVSFACAVWRVSWSVTGNILAVSGGDNQVTLWKESLLGEWTQIGQLSEDGSAAGR